MTQLRLMESIALVSLFGIDDYILLVTDNPYLMEFLLQMQKRSFIKSRITFISSYHFVLAFFTRCHITTEHLLKFQGNYFQNLLHSKDSIIQQWAKNLVKKAMEETPRAVKEKPEIYGPDAEKQEIIRLITSFSLININDYQTIGNYRRFDENSRNAIFSLFECIVENLKSEIVERKNFIIWAPPGSGKTFLIKEIAKRLLTSNNVFYEINMAKISGKKELSGKLNKISRKYSKKQIIVLFDEIDAHYDSTWPFEVILGFLDNLTVKPIPLIFFAGSAENSLEEFIRRKIANRPKGKDVLSRIFIHNRFNLPVSVDGDRLIMAISEIINFNKTNGYNISYIEKAALYYLLSKEGLKNPRQLTEYIKRSLGNVNKLDLRLKYDQLFNYGSKEIKSFWTETKEIEGLYDHFIQIHS
ncbi:MAG: AAA family ATPase [Candidatus Odinarchaeota archaeon]